jgi:hypothetical protein
MNNPPTVTTITNHYAASNRTNTNHQSTTSHDTNNNSDYMNNDRNNHMQIEQEFVVDDDDDDDDALLATIDVEHLMSQHSKKPSSSSSSLSSSRFVSTDDRSRSKTIKPHHSITTTPTKQAYNNIYTASNQYRSTHNETDHSDNDNHHNQRYLNHTILPGPTSVQGNLHSHSYAAASNTTIASGSGSGSDSRYHQTSDPYPKDKSLTNFPENFHDRHSAYYNNNSTVPSNPPDGSITLTLSSSSSASSSLDVVPHCSGHHIPCRTFTARSEANHGRQFYKCSINDPQQQCDFFQWVDGVNTSSNNNNNNNGMNNGTAASWNETSTRSNVYNITLDRTLTTTKDPIVESRHKFGHRSFRPGQQDVITNAIAGRDVFVLMPTGGGKSLCYQVRAVIF